MEYMFNEKVFDVLKSKSKTFENSMCLLHSDISLNEINNILVAISLSAASKHIRVLIIRTSPMVSFPFISTHEGRNINYNELENVKFVYMNDYEEVINYWSCLHNSSEFAGVILIENFDSVFESVEDPFEVYFAKMSSLLRNSLEFIRSQAGFCKLIVVSGLLGSSLTDIVPLYYDNMWKIAFSLSKDHVHFELENVWEKYSVKFKKNGDNIVFQEIIFD